MKDKHMHTPPSPTVIVTTIRTWADWKRWVVIALFFLFLSGVVTVRYMETHPQISPYDEYAYIDSVDKAQRGIVTRTGQETDDYAREQLACLGYGTTPQTSAKIGTCGNIEADNDIWPSGGFNTASVHSPLYFFITAWLATPIQKIFNVGLMNAARITGALWLGLGMTVFSYTLRRTQSSWGMSVAIPILLISMPVFRATNAAITPDAFNLLCGSGILLAGILYASHEWPAWPLILISSLSVLIKFQNIFALVAIWLFLLWYRVAPAGAGHKLLPRWRDLIIMPLTAGFVAVAWMAVRTQIALPTVTPSIDPPASLNWRSVPYWFDDTVRIVLAGTDGTGNPTDSSIFPSIALWLFLAAMVAAAFFERDNTVIERRFAQSGLVSLLAIGPAVTVSFAFVFDSQVAMQSRYAMVLTPLLALCLGPRLERRSVRYGFYLFTLCAYMFAVVFSHAN